MSISLRTWAVGCALAGMFGVSIGLTAQTPVTAEPVPSTAGQLAKDGSGKQQLGIQTPGQKNGGTQSPAAGIDAASGKAGDQGGPSKSANGSSGGIASTAPSVPPPGPSGRRRIGVALGGGGALGLSEIGALQWFEEHHIPVDVIAGTSMGGMISALYATGNSVDQLKDVMNDQVFGSVFRISTSYASRSFRRREDSRDLPNGLNVGLKHGVSFRNSVLIDQGLNSFLDREFLRYDDQVDFNTLPIPFRCLSTDLNEARTVTFARGSLADAVRASISIPGIYRPFEMNGHEYVDGAVLANLPTQTVRSDLGADVVIAVSLPLVPVGKNDLDSIVGVLQRSFSVAIEGNERTSRRLADVVIEPDLTGFSASDYLKSPELAARGYAAAEKMKDALLPYAVDDTTWNTYLAQRTARKRGPAGTLLRVRVEAPNQSVTQNVERIFAPLIDRPVATDRVESLLADIRSDGRYDADYTVGYDKGPDRRPVLLVTVQDKKTGPPFLELGANVAAQTGGVSRATLEGILLNQDLGGYGSELRSHIKLGYLTDFDSEYFRRVPNFLQIRPAAPVGTVFIAPHGGILRQPFPIYQGKVRVSERQLQKTGGGVDIGWSDGSTTEIRAGWEENDIRWHEQIGISDGLPDVTGSMQRARVRYALDKQDKAFVPQFGYRVTAEAGYLYNTAGGSNAPVFDTQITLGHKFGKQIIAFGSEAGTMFNRNVAQPYRFTLGGPLRLSASGLDELRGTDYFFVRPAVLRKVASLPAVLGQSIYVGGAYEAGQMRAPDMRTVMRQDVFLGVLAETPAGVISFGPAIGDGGRYKLMFTLGKLF